jgi:alkanesulfonate monooxygenase SsuD/methylene tetrahydromethanopterin reductase-like flavin-dependent oxidoreductase (luciferase family)
MKIGAFMMPAHPPNRSLADGHYHDLDTISFLDKLGYEEVWIGEHYNLPAEPHPSPDLLIAQAILQTKHILLAPGGFMLPFHHPAELAHRICLLDHISGGRLMVGIGASGNAPDLQMFNLDPQSGINRRMMVEAIDIMVRFWVSDRPFEFKGEFWTVSRPADTEDKICSYHIRPLQKPHPPIGVTGLSPSSPTLRLAGANGWLPISFCYSTSYLRGHWQTVCDAADAAGREPPPRDIWRISRNIYVADTWQEAWNRTVNGETGRYYRENFLPLLAKGGMLSALKHDPEVPDSDVTVEYCARHCWMIGSPVSVAEQIQAMQDAAGGFGVLHVLCMDHLDEMQSWRNSLAAIAHDVLPRLSSGLYPAP